MANAAKISVQISGVDATLNRLAAAGRLDSAVVKKIIRTHTQPVINTAKALVSVDTGRLKNSIGFITKKESRYPYTVLLGADYRRGGQAAHLIEGGTQLRVRGPKGGSKQDKKALRTLLRNAATGQVKKSTLANELASGLSSGKYIKTGKVSARPFFTPAVNLHRAEITKNTARDLKKAVKNNAKKNNLKTR